jgi:hypothetical protein
MRPMVITNVRQTTERPRLYRSRQNAHSAAIPSSYKPAFLIVLGWRA